MNKLFTNIKKNIMGTISFDAKFAGMRKAQDFIVYPITDNKQVHIQSENRFGIINLNNNILTLSANHNFANGMRLQIDIATNKAKINKINSEDLQELIDAIRGTGSKDLVGDSFVKVDNSVALSL
jgi:hypothetical protein